MMDCCPRTLFFILLGIAHVCSGYDSRSLLLHGYSPVGNFGSRFVRDERSFYESDKRPELQATHEKDFIVLKCSVKVRVQNAEIYLLCPASGDRRGMGHCYQGCTPTNPCPDPSHREQKMCVPNNQTVFCKQEKFANGTTTIEVRVDRTDPRLSGTWYCTYTGLKSTEFKIGSENPEAVEVKTERSESTQKRTTASAKFDTIGSHKKYEEIDERPLAYMRKPVIMFTVVAILIVSVLINVGFCVRCLIMRSYIDAQNEGSDNVNCLATCLCLPKEMRKVSSVRSVPVLPRSACNPANLNGSYHGSAGLLYPSATSTMQKIPLLLQPAPQNELGGMTYYPAMSMTGTLGRQNGQRLYGTPLVQPQQPPQPLQSHSDGYPTPQLGYAVNMDGGSMPAQTAGPSHSQGSLPTMNEYGKPTAYMPSYIRVSSVNAPSPSLSQKLIYTGNNAIIQPPQGFANDQGLTVLSDGQTGPQYFVKVPPTVFGPHVIYDDVAAGNSSIAGSQTRSQNQSLLVEQLPNNMVSVPTFYQISQSKAPSAESSPNINTSRIRGLLPTVRMGTGYGVELAPVPPTTDATGSGSFVPSNFGNSTTSESNQPERSKTSNRSTPMGTNNTPETHRSNTNMTENSTEPIVYSRLTGMAPLAKEATPRISVLDSAPRQQSNQQQTKQKPDKSHT